MEAEKSLVRVTHPLVEIAERRDLPFNPEGLEKRIEKLGFKKVSKKIEIAKRLSIAYEKYMFVTLEKIDKFNENLRKETLKEDSRARTYKKLMFIPIDEYDAIPPNHVLDRIEAAQKDNIFDRFEVAKIDWVKEVKDPIVFGKIEGCPDFFFIAQWDDDVRFEDIVFTK